MDSNHKHPSSIPLLHEPLLHSPQDTASANFATSYRPKPPLLSWTLPAIASRCHASPARPSPTDAVYYSTLPISSYGLVHIAAGDLLRAEIAAGTLNGKLAKEYMEKGMLVPDEIVVVMVKERLLQPDAQENGWLLDGYPRSLSQAKALEDLGIRPDIFILLDVNENALVERVVGRRLDPVSGKIYHLKYSPPENEEIAARLVQRFDDTEEKVKLRLQTHHQNLESVLSLYNDITVKVNGDLSKEEVFGEIDRQLSLLLEMKSKADSTSMPAGMAH